LPTVLSAQDHAQFVPSDITKENDPAKNIFDFGFIYAADIKKEVMITLRRGAKNPGLVCYYPYQLNDKNLKISWQPGPRTIDDEKNPTEESFVTDFDRKIIMGNLKFRDQIRPSISITQDPELDRIVPTKIEKHVDPNQQGRFAVCLQNEEIRYAFIGLDKTEELIYVGDKPDPIRPGDKADKLGLKPPFIIRKIAFVPSVSKENKNPKLVVSLKDQKSLMIISSIFGKDKSDPKFTPLKHNSANVLDWDFSSDRNTLISLDEDGILYFWENDPSFSKISKSSEQEKNKNVVTCIAHARGPKSDESWIATGDTQGNILLWKYKIDASGGSKKVILEKMNRSLQYQVAINKLQFSNDGQILAALVKTTGDDVGVVGVWPCRKFLPDK
jgi:WD40 repeat protein